MMDTHATVKELQATGIPESQAEALVKAITATIDDSRGALATKADVAQVRTEIEHLRADVEKGLANLETRLTNKIMGMTGFTLAGMGLLLKLLS